MNQELVDSLVQAIEALSPEERKMLETRLSANIIQETPGVCGGYPRIRNTRIPVWTLVSLRQQGSDESDLLRNYPSLSPQDWEHPNSEIGTVVPCKDGDIAILN